MMPIFSIYIHSVSENILLYIYREETHPRNKKKQTSEVALNFIRRAPSLVPDRIMNRRLD
jgi:hypothetical protein